MIRMREGKSTAFVPPGGAAALIVEPIRCRLPARRETLILLPVASRAADGGGYNLGGYHIRPGRGFSPAQDDRSSSVPGLSMIFTGRGRLFSCGEGKPCTIRAASVPFFSPMRPIPCATSPGMGIRHSSSSLSSIRAEGTAFISMPAARTPLSSRGGNRAGSGTSPLARRMIFIFVTSPPRKNNYSIYTNLSAVPACCPAGPSATFSPNMESERRRGLRWYAKFAKRAIPVSAVILDHYWFDLWGLDWHVCTGRSSPGRFLKSGHQAGDHHGSIFREAQPNYGTFYSLDMIAQD